MKFIRRPDLDPHTRIDIVKLAWQGQGIYGKICDPFSRNLEQSKGIRGKGRRSL
jgi:hypothetical protein